MTKKAIEKPNVEKIEGRFVLQPTEIQVTRSQTASDLMLLQSGKVTTAEMAAILTRVLTRIEHLE
jgi:hypothetical protein